MTVIYILSNILGTTVKFRISVYILSYILLINVSSNNSFSEISTNEIIKIQFYSKINGKSNLIKNISTDDTYLVDRLDKDYKSKLIDKMEIISSYSGKISVFVIHNQEYISDNPNDTIIRVNYDTHKTKSEMIIHFDSVGEVSDPYKIVIMKDDSLYKMYSYDIFH